MSKKLQGCRKVGERGKPLASPKLDPVREFISQFERLHAVRGLREMVRRIWKIDVEAVDRDGIVLDRGRGKVAGGSVNRFCHKCLLDKEGLSRCDRTVREITAEIRRVGRVSGAVYDQCHAGFKYLAVPVRIGGEFIGAILGGGFLSDPPDTAKTLQILEKTSAFSGAEIPEPDRAIAEIPVLTDTQVRALTDVVSFGVEELGRVLLQGQRAGGSAVETAEARASSGGTAMIGTSTAMRTLHELLDKLRDSDSTVLIQGENGTGKELVAKQIHFASDRRLRPFVTQNCSALNDNLLDSELFGHVRGSFTGAVRDKKGLFEVADGGTFFMDEIGDMSTTLQVKLLRVLQEGMFVPVGGTEPRHVDVRIIAATNKNLKRMVENGEFREDLFYRLNVINIVVPPLRDRREDIPLLAAHFLAKFARPGGVPKGLSPEAMDALVAYNWPGNVRQLENEIQRAMVLSGRSPEIGRDLLSPTLTTALAGSVQVKLKGKLRDTLEHVERQVILEGLRRHGWNKSRLSRELGVSRATLIWKIQKYGLTDDRRS